MPRFRFRFHIGADTSVVHSQVDMDSSRESELEFDYISPLDYLPARWQEMLLRAFHVGIDVFVPTVEQSVPKCIVMVSMPRHVVFEFRDVPPARDPEPGHQSLGVISFTPIEWSMIESNLDTWLLLIGSATVCGKHSLKY